jgi:hypothetical protein
VTKWKSTLSERVDLSIMTFPLYSMAFEMLPISAIMYSICQECGTDSTGQVPHEKGTTI